MIRHIVIVQFKKGPLSEQEYCSCLEDVGKIVLTLPGVRQYDVFRNESKYVPKDMDSFGVEIIFEDQKSLNAFMENPKHFEANSLFEKYLADPPYMVLTHAMVPRRQSRRSY